MPPTHPPPKITVTQTFKFIDISVITNMLANVEVYHLCCHDSGMCIIQICLAQPCTDVHIYMCIPFVDKLGLTLYYCISISFKTSLSYEI